MSLPESHTNGGGHRRCSLLRSVVRLWLLGVQQVMCLYLIARPDLGSLRDRGFVHVPMKQMSSCAVTVQA